MNAVASYTFADSLARRLAAWCEQRAMEPVLAQRLVALTQALAAETEAGHVCLSLHAFAALVGDSAENLRAQLLKSGWVAKPHSTQGALFVLDAGDRVYFKRHFDYERRLGARIATALAQPIEQPGPAAIDSLRRLFGTMKLDGSQWQALAAALALHRHFVVVSGGPGTGKTTTVAYLLAALLEENPQLRISMAAPTGKAAARLTAAIQQRAVELPAHVRAGLSKPAQTVHRLLGYSPAGFRYHARELLPLDVLVVDEASMLDVSLATQLLEAVPAQARILLLGDRDQLEAVESGAVFAQLCQSQSLSEAMRARLSQVTNVPLSTMTVPFDAADPLADAVIRYTRTFRFRDDSAVGQLALAVRDGKSDAAFAALGSASNDLRWTESAGIGLPSGLIEELASKYQDYFTQAVAVVADPDQILQVFDHVRVLCAQREGPLGITSINARLTRALCAAAGVSGGASWYAGRPVLITRNDPLLGLFNGDVGVTLTDAAGRLRVWVRVGETLRSFSPSQLPAHETAFAMTVHKSQGSEFNHATVILPREDSPLLTRELLYTAITRVRHSLHLVGSRGAIATAIERPSNRLSGLRDRIRDACAVPQAELSGSAD